MNTDQPPGILWNNYLTHLPLLFEKQIDEWSPSKLNCLFNIIARVSSFFLFFFLLYFLFSFFLLRKILTYRSLAMNDVIYALSISLAAERKISEDESTLLISTTQKCMPKSKLFQQFSYYTVNYDAHCLFIWYISIRNCRNRSKMVSLVNRSLDRGRKDPF